MKPLIEQLVSHLKQKKRKSMFKVTANIIHSHSKLKFECDVTVQLHLHEDTEGVVL